MKEPAFSPASVADLRDILVRISKDKPEAAKRFVATLKSKCYLLAESPEIGSSRADLSPGLRAFTVRSYVIYYHATDSGIRVERVLHGARDVGAMFWG